MFKCPNCDKRLYVVDSVTDIPDKSYRKLKCHNCGEKFYTVETMVDPEDPTFKREWSLNHRGYKGYYAKMN